MLEKARYFIAVLMLATVPPAIGLWYIIHPFARAWRRIGPRWTYLIVAPAAIGTALLLWLNRGTLVGRDLGTRIELLVLAVPFFVAGAMIARLRRRHLTQRILVGVPELSAGGEGRLLTEGIYARTRNPRYLEFLLFVFAYVAFANYVGTWILYLLTFPAIHLVVVLEERELRDRFGAAYDDYCSRVPRYLPRL